MAPGMAQVMNTFPFGTEWDSGDCSRGFWTTQRGTTWHSLIRCLNITYKPWKNEHSTSVHPQPVVDTAHLSCDLVHWSLSLLREVPTHCLVPLSYCCFCHLCCLFVVLSTTNCVFHLALLGLDIYDGHYSDYVNVEPWFQTATYKVNRWSVV